MAKKIISLFPKHSRYVECFGGAGSVLLRKERSAHEVYNDLDSRIVNLFKVVRENPEELVKNLEMTPYSRQEFDNATEPCHDPVEDARRLVVLASMGFSSDSCTRRTKTGFRSHENAVKTFANGFSHYLSICERMKGVVIENIDAIECILKYDSEDTLHYVDPPYVLSSRNNASGGYRHEMTDSDHAALSEVLNGVKGSVIISAYRTEMYDCLYRKFKRFDIKAIASSSSGSVERVESLYCLGGSV